MFSLNNTLIMEKSGKLLVAQLKWNLSLLVKQICDIPMESFITVHYETTGITFQNRGSDSLSEFEEGQPHSKNHI